MEIPNYYPIEDPSEVPNGTINGNQDLLTLFGLDETYDTYVKPYIKPTAANATDSSTQIPQDNGEARRNKMESTFKLFVNDLPGRNTISKKDSSLPKIRDLLFDPEFQPPTITADSIDNATLVEAFGRLPPGSIPNFDASVFTGRDDDDERRKKKKKKRRREDEDDGINGVANGEKKTRIDDRALTVPAHSTTHSPNPASIRGTSR
ncbi:hypothetical protein E3P81_01184 [Wallemia ichthyophaga]|nr:hypothetical protein E3P97_01185 [Wallemia ichthyophaga]TIB04897.1 hypothetical protein E3P96_01496 [Wallemia ichthyophaga]TIB34374.1 hypothetical protein E3P85_00934 [Wallemia ichthyophaga]TIB48730.1 hypothetical protein E3P82_01183 [Wallemia ichthyophaga]TIB52777.1 hypothetical protein E3P81_01184 [Wallemia ichthyophaga]